MTKEEIAIGNRIIGEYMGLPDVKIDQGETIARVPSPKGWEEQFPRGGIIILSYHSNWNQLMSVVDKLEESGQILVFFEMKGDDGNKERLVKFMSRPWYGFGSEKFTDTKIEATFQAVVELIKSINENKDDL